MVYGKLSVLLDDLINIHFHGLGEVEIMLKDKGAVLTTLESQPLDEL